MSRPGTLGDLKSSGWESTSVKEEIRRNAIARIRAGEPLFPQVMGYEDTVVPQLENALIAGHDIVFLGERGQAKTRMIRSLVELLDEWMPIGRDQRRPLADLAVRDSPSQSTATRPDRLGIAATATARAAPTRRSPTYRRGRPHQGC